MKGISFAVVAAALLAACASGPSLEFARRQVALQNADFEMENGPHCARHWGCSAHSDMSSFRFTADASVKAGGQKSLRIERVKGEPWALVTQVVPAGGLRGARLRFSLAVRVEGASGEGGGALFKIQDLSGRTIAHQQRLVRGTHDWQRLEMSFDVPKEAHVIDVGATLEGPGTIWIDDARLDVVREAAR